MNKNTVKYFIFPFIKISSNDTVFFNIKYAIKQITVFPKKGINVNITNGIDQPLPFAITIKTDITDIPKPLRGYKENNIARFFLIFSLESIIIFCLPHILKKLLHQKYF